MLLKSKPEEEKYQKLKNIKKKNTILRLKF
jgi:hypothetical protein